MNAALKTNWLPKGGLSSNPIKKLNKVLPYFVEKDPSRDKMQLKIKKIQHHCNTKCIRACVRSRTFNIDLKTILIKVFY